MQTKHRERHSLEKHGWLRAAVLGANDGIVSTASLIAGVAAANSTHASIMLAGVSALIAGAMSMATGEYVSVSSQADAQRAVLEQERRELATDYTAEERELMGIYMRRGLEQPLAAQVADRLMRRNPLEAHARDELGMSAATAARPLQAALASAASFAAGSALPLAVSGLAPQRWLVAAVAASALLSLAALGALAARIAGAKAWPGVVRIVFWSALALGLTAGVGSLFGVAG